MARRFALSLPEFRGLDEDENPHALQPGDLREALNTWRLGRSTGTRPGTILEPDGDYASPLPEGTVCGIADFRRSRDTARTLVAVVPGNIYSDDGTALDLATNTVVVTNAAELPWTFAQHKNILYAAGGDLTTDEAWYWDPSVGAGDVVNQLPILNLSATAVYPRYIYSWRNRLWACGFDESDASANPGIVRFSALNDGLTWPTDQSFGGNFSVGGFAADAEEYLTGFSSYADNRGSWLLVLSNRRLYGLQQIPEVEVVRLTEEIALGCVSQSAFVSLGVDAGDSLFLSEWGIHSLRQTLQHGGKEERFLSWPIRKTFEKINRSRMNQIVGAYWRRYGYAVWAVPIGSSTQNDTILALDLRDIPADGLTSETARWHIWRLSGTNHKASCLAAGRDSLNGKHQLYIGTYGGNVCAFSDNYFGDVGQAYNVRVSTKYSTIGLPTRTKVMGPVYVDVGPGGSHKPSFQATFDFGREPQTPVPLEMPADGALWDSGIWDVSKFGDENSVYRNKLYVTGRGDVVSFTVSHAALNEPFYIHGIFAEMAEQGEGTES